MKIHLVFSEDFIDLKDTIESNNHEVIEWDYSIKQFCDFSKNKNNKADIALIDGANNPDKKATIELLAEIRRNIPELRLIINFPEKLHADTEFIDKLLSLSIYDLYFQDRFTIEDIKVWILNKKTYANYDIRTDDIKGSIEQTSNNFETNIESDKKTSKWPISPSININLSRTQVKEKIVGSILIGITSAKPGAGSTFASIQIAHFLSQYGKTAVVELVDSSLSSKSFNALSKYVDDKTWQYKQVDYHIIDDDYDYAKLLQGKYLYIVFDFGYILNDNNKSKYFNEIARVNMAILVSQPNNWNLPFLHSMYKKLSHFRKDWNILFSPTNKEAQKEYKGDESLFVYHNSFIDNPQKYKSYDNTEFNKMFKEYIPNHLLEKRKSWKLW